MLSLARRENETLHFYTPDGLIAVTDRVIKGNQVKLSIDASDIVNVIRSEIDVLHTDINNIVQVNLA
jgi:sRNA-binding carbon storage regulator CsrA